MAYLSLKKKRWTAAAVVLSGFGVSHIIHTQTLRQKDLHVSGPADFMGIPLQLESRLLSNQLSEVIILSLLLDLESIDGINLN